MSVKNGETSGFVGAITVDADSKIAVFVAADAHGDKIESLAVANTRALHNSGIAIADSRRNTVVSLNQ